MCNECGCHHHGHLHVTLPVNGLTNSFMAQDLQSALNDLPGIDHALADLKKRQVSFTLAEGGNLEKAHTIIEQFS
ncbi:MAG: hypothetical protein ACOX05_04515 [Bacillota bacterium]|jgi:hypothetical protein